MAYAKNVGDAIMSVAWTGATEKYVNITTETGDFYCSLCGNLSSACLPHFSIGLEKLLLHAYVGLVQNAYNVYIYNDRKDFGYKPFLIILCPDSISKMARPDHGAF